MNLAMNDHMNLAINDRRLTKPGTMNAALRDFKDAYAFKNKPPYAGEYYVVWPLVKGRKLPIIFSICGKIDRSRICFTRTC